MEAENAMFDHVAKMIWDKPVRSGGSKDEGVAETDCWSPDTGLPVRGAAV